jgi:hypothetical protein
VGTMLPPFIPFLLKMPGADAARETNFEPAT